MFSEDRIELYREYVRNYYNKLLNEDKLTNCNRYKLQGADMILSTILRKQRFSYFIRLANLDKRIK